MKVNVRLFAELREIAGQSDVILDMKDQAKGGEVWERLSAAFPGLGRLAYRPLLARNGTYVPWDERFQDGDEAAFLAPVGGG